MTAAPLSPKFYGIGTFDALFKYVLINDTIRVSFLNAFLPDVNVKSSTRLDEHMNPIQQLQLVRDGRREGAFEIARKMLVRGRPLEEIVEDSGLSKEEVEVIKTAASHEDRYKP